MPKTEEPRETMTRMWTVMRRNAPDVPDEVVVVTADESLAYTLAEHLGVGHDVQAAPVLNDRTGYTIVGLWRCRVTAAAGEAPKVAEPERLAGATQLVLPGHPVPNVERVRVDEQAGVLAAAVGDQVVYVEGYAASGERARELAVAKAAELSPQNPL